MAVEKKTELTVSCENKPGQLARILETLAKADVNVIAFVGYSEGPKATIMLVPDDPAKASGALKAAKFPVKTNQVVTISCPSGKGVGSQLARRLGQAGVNLDYAYASEGLTVGDSTIVFGTKDADKAAKALA